MSKQKSICVQFRLNGGEQSDYRPIVVMVRLAGEKKYTTCKTGLYIYAKKWQPYLRQKLHPSVMRDKTVEARLDATRSLMHQLFAQQTSQRAIHERGAVTGRSLIREFRNLTSGTEGQVYA